MRLFLLTLALLVLLRDSGAFSPPRAPLSSSSTSTTELNMVFQNFFKKAGEQLSNIAQANYEGKLGEDFFNGLAKSRDQMKQSMELLLTGKSDDMMEDLFNDKQED